LPIYTQFSLIKNSYLLGTLELIDLNHWQLRKFVILIFVQILKYLFPLAIDSLTSLHFANGHFLTASQVPSTRAHNVTNPKTCIPRNHIHVVPAFNVTLIIGKIDWTAIRFETNIFWCNGLLDIHANTILKSLHAYIQSNLIFSASRMPFTNLANTIAPQSSSLGSETVLFFIRVTRDLVQSSVLQLSTSSTVCTYIQGFNATYISKLWLPTCLATGACFNEFAK